MSIVGYTSGVFDLFHIGHLNLINKSKELCDYLIVAVSTDELVFEYKGYRPVIPFEERARIVEAIKGVDRVVPQYNRNKIQAYERYSFQRLFVGDDWAGNTIFEETDKYMKEKGDDGVFYLPYTKGISTTELKQRILGR